jgi:hypothetical protein
VIEAYAAEGLDACNTVLKQRGNTRYPGHPFVRAMASLRGGVCPTQGLCTPSSTGCATTHAAGASQPTTRATWRILMCTQ